MKCQNCGSELIKGALFCASCGTRVPAEVAAEPEEKKLVEAPSEPVSKPEENKPEDTTSASAQDSASEPVAESVTPENPIDFDKKKKRRTRLIGVAAVAVVVAAAGFGGWKAWNMMHPSLDKQLVYAKNGRLYYTGNVAKEKDPVEIYNSHSDNSDFNIQYSDDKKYAFFLSGEDDKQRLYRVNTQKLTSDENKNEKYIEEIDTKVDNYSIIDADKVLYYRNTGDSWYELYYFNGKDTEEIDRDVVRQYHTNDTVYYMCDDEDEDNYKLYYYKLSNAKQGDLGECSDVSDYNDNEILYAINNGDSYDIYKAKVGGKATKIISDVSYNWSGDLDTGVIYYEKTQVETHSYYDFVNDPYAADDASVTEPDMTDYFDIVDPVDCLSEYAYNDYINYPDDFYYYDTYYDYDLGLYSYYNEDQYYIDQATGTFYRYDSDAYSQACDNYYEVEKRNDLREELKEMSYDTQSYDLYLYTAKGGEKKIVESVLPMSSDVENKMFFYQKAEDVKDEKVCSIDDLYYASDVSDYLGSSDSDAAIYANIDGKEQKMDAECVGFDVSKNGKLVMVTEQRDEDSSELIAYENKNGTLKKVGTVEKECLSGEWHGNDYYYFDQNHDFYIYTGGKTKKIAKDVGYAELESDGNYMVYDYELSDNRDMRIVNNKEQINKIRDARDGTYISENCIPYITNDGDLYVYDGEDSRKIDRDVANFWASKNSGIGFSAWY